MGLMLIGPSLIESGRLSFIPIVVSWAGVFFTIFGFALILSCIPIKRIKDGLPAWTPFAGAAALCFLILIWKGIVLWRDISFLSQ
jgi:hypothetical protein